jgi:hypothetical protein
LRSQLDSSALHALSNHLSVILGFVEIVIAKTPADDPRRGELVEIRDAAQRAAAIVEDARGSKVRGSEG